MAPTLEEYICSRDKHQGDADAPNQTRDKSALISNSFLDRTNVQKQKEKYISLDRAGKPPLKMTKEILNQVDDDLGIQESEGPCIDKILAEKNKRAYFNTSAHNISSQI